MIRGMGVHRKNAAARQANIAEQQLYNGFCADNLLTLGLLRPADGVTEGRRAFASRVLNQHPHHLHPLLAWHAADALDHLGSVTCEVAAQYPEGATRVLQRRARHWSPMLITFVLPPSLVGL